MNVLDYIEKMKEMYEGPRITAQEPRNMAQGGRIGLKPGGIVEPGVMYYGRDPDPYKLNPEQIEELTKKVKKFNKQYGLKRKGIRVAIEKTQAGGTTLRLQTNPAVWKDYFKGLGISLKKSAAPNIDGFNELETIIKGIVKTDIFKTYDKSKVMKAGGVKSGLKQLENIGSKQAEIMKYLIDKPNADVATIAKDLKLDSKLVKADLKDLYGNIYKRVGDQGAAFLTDYDLKQLNNARDSIKKINLNEGLNLKDKIKHLVTDAYQGDKATLKPLLEKIDNFYTLQTKIKGTQYGKFFAGNLDHIIPLNFLKQVAAGEDPLNLIRVKPIPEFLNQRAWKSQFDRVLGTAWRNRLNPGGKGALEAIINLQSYLPKEFGGITSTGNIIDYGAKPFSLKTNLSQADFPEIYKRVFQFINNPELQTTFKEAGVSFKTLAKQEKNIMGQMEGFKKLLTKLGCPDLASGGRVGFSTGTNCAVKGRYLATELLGSGTANTKQKQILKEIMRMGANAMKGLGKSFSPAEMLKLKNLVGPGAWAAMGAFEAGAIGYDTINRNTPLNEALSDNWVTGWAMPWTKKEAQIKNLEKANISGSPAMKNYMERVKLMAEYESADKSLNTMKTGGGPFGTEFSKEMIQDQQTKLDKLLGDWTVLTKLSTVKRDGKNYPIEGGEIEFQKAVSDMAGERKAGYHEPDISEGIPRDLNEYGYRDVGDAPAWTKKVFGKAALQGHDPMFETTGIQPIFDLPPSQIAKATSTKQEDLIRPLKEKYGTSPLKGYHEIKRPLNLKGATTTPLDADTLQMYAENLRNIGILEPREGLPQWYIDMVQKDEKWRQLFEQSPTGLHGAAFAGGGMVGIRKPNAIAPTGGPMSQGLRSLYINDRDY